jgi:hypothetical protein
VAGVSIDFCLLHWSLFEHFQARFTVPSTPPNHFTVNHVYPCIYSHALSISIQVILVQDTQIRKSIVQNSSSEADRLSDSQEITYFLFKLNARYRVYNSRPLDPILGQIYPVHNFQTHFYKIDVNIMCPFTSRCSRWSLSFSFSN